MIVIKKFEMPQNCAECAMLHDSDGVWWCSFGGNLMSAHDLCAMQKRRDDCPLEEVPDAEPQKAQWEYYPALYAYGVPHYKCSLCGHQVQYRTPYCPGCGSEMRREG